MNDILHFIQASPLVALMLVAAVGLLLFSRSGGDKPAELNRQLPAITPVAKTRTNVEVLQALDVVCDALRQKGWPESEVSGIVTHVTPKLYSAPPPSAS